MCVYIYIYTYIYVFRRVKVNKIRKPSRGIRNTCEWDRRCNVGENINLKGDTANLNHMAKTQTRFAAFFRYVILFWIKNRIFCNHEIVTFGKVE